MQAQRMASQTAQLQAFGSRMPAARSVIRRTWLMHMLEALCFLPACFLVHGMLECAVHLTCAACCSSSDGTACTGAEEGFDDVGIATGSD
jgi:hypothetical protein